MKIQFQYFRTHFQFYLLGSTFSPGAYADTIIIEAQCEMKKFDEAIKFISDVINYPHFTGLNIFRFGPSAKSLQVSRTVSDDDDDDI